MRARALGLHLGLAVALNACSSEPCVCPPQAAVANALEVAAEPEPATIVGDSPGAQLALETLDRIFARDFAPVRALFTPELAAELTDEALTKIVVGLVQAHGPPAKVMDAWASQIREKEEVMPAAQALVRMANDTRVNLLLVFDPNGAVRGLWLRPI